MDSFSLPVDPLLNLNNSLEYLNQPSLETGEGGSAAASVPLPELDYSFWLNPTSGAPFDPAVSSTSLSSESLAATSPGVTPLNATNRFDNGRRPAPGPSSNPTRGQTMPSGSGVTPNASLGGLLPSTSDQASFDQVDLFPASFTESLDQATRNYTTHQGDILVDPYTLPLDLSAATTSAQDHRPQQSSSHAAGPSNGTRSVAGDGEASTSSTDGLSSGRQPHPDESVPEAALHLLRLALPSGSSGSVGTSATVDDEDSRFEQDGDGGSAATSVHSNLGDSKGKGRAVQQFGQDGQVGDIRLWEHAAGQPPLEFNVGSAPRVGSGRASAASSNGQARQHHPGDVQREGSASTRAGSEGGALVGDSLETERRRKSGRVRKTILPSPVHLGDSDSGEEYNEADVSEAELYGSDSDVELAGNRKSKGAKGKGQGKAKAQGSVPGSAAGPKVKRASEGQPNPTAAKKPRTSGDAPPPPRRPRRAPASLNHLVNRPLPSSVPIDPAFARFYRAFPMSAAIPPESYIFRAPRPPPPPPRTVTSTSIAQHLPLPQGKNGQIDHFAAALQNQALASTPTAGRAGADGASENGSVYTESQTEEDDDPYNWFLQPPAGATWNKAATPFNLYTPRFVKGNALQKCGMCPICVEPVARGGFGEEQWLKLKNSSYVYHMSHAHGISNVTGLPFSPPKDLRSRPLNATTKDTREIMREGLCHKCDQWIPLDSTKNVEALVPELFWFKHCKKCHHDSRMAGDSQCFVEDSVWRLAKQAAAQTGTNV